MTFTPVNNYLYVKTLDEVETPDTGILLPQDYRAVDNPFAAVEVLSSSGDGEVIWEAGLQLIVEARMLQDIQLAGQTYTVIKENYIIGILSE